MDALARWFLQTCLLPKLRVFKYVVEGAEGNIPPSWIPVFFSSPTLSEVCFHGKSTESMYQAIDCIPPVLTMLHNLTIQLPLGTRRYLSYSTVKTQLSSFHPLLQENEFLWKHSGLQSLQLRCVVVITPTIIYRLSRLPALYHLSLHHPVLMLQTAENNSLLPSLGVAFPKLRSLQLETTISGAYLFLSATPSLRGLESLNLTLSVGEPWRGAVEHIPQASLHSLYSRFPMSLSSLRLHFLIITASWTTELVPNFSEMTTPLFSFPSLRALSFHQTSFMGHGDAPEPQLTSLTNTALLSIRPVWPELEVFKYEVSRVPMLGPDGDHPALASIVAFAHAHPRLRQLSIPYMNRSSIHDARLHPTTNLKQAHPLKQLEIGTRVGKWYAFNNAGGWYALGNAALLSEAARAFLEAFPNIETTTFPPCAPGLKTFSEELADAIASLRASRR